MVKELLGKIPVTWRMPLMVLLTVAVALMLWLYGTRAWNGVGNWAYHHSENDAKREITAIKADAAKETEIANKAVAAYEESRAAYEEEKKRHDITKQILADRTKNTDQKLAAYEAAVAARPTVTGPESDAELCARAAALGLSVRCN